MTKRAPLQAPKLIVTPLDLGAGKCEAPKPEAYRHVNGYVGLMVDVELQPYLKFRVEVQRYQSGTRTLDVPRGIQLDPIIGNLVMIDVNVLTLIEEKAREVWPPK